LYNRVILVKGGGIIMGYNIPLNGNFFAGGLADAIRLTEAIHVGIVFCFYLAERLLLQWLAPAPGTFMSSHLDSYHKMRDSLEN